MNFHHLIVFREIMKTGSMSAAARNLHRTQPAISAALKGLEENLGITLFRREGRRLVPVPEAQYLLSEATDILDRLNNARANLTGMKHHTRGTLRIVAMPGPSAYLLPEFVSRFRDRSGDLKVTLATRSSPQIRNLMATQSFDIGFCDHADSDDTPRNRDLFSEQAIPCTCLCALSANHPLAGREVLTPRDLAREQMGALQPGHSTRINTERAFEQTGVAFPVAVEAQYFVPLFHFVEAGQICALVDPLSAHTYRCCAGANAGIRFVRFEPAVAHVYAILIPQQRPLSLVAQDFVGQWRQYVQDILGMPP